MQWLIDLFILGSLSWWIITIIAGVIIALSVDNDHPKWATIVFFGYAAALNSLSHVPIVANIKEWWVWWIFAAIVYSLIGVAWSFARWWSFLHDEKNKFLTNAKPYSYLRDESIIRPQARDHRDRIMGWMCYWPFSMASFGLEFVWKFAAIAFDKCEKTYNTMSDSIFSSIELPKPEEQVEATRADIRENFGRTRRP